MSRTSVPVRSPAIRPGLAALLLLWPAADARAQRAQAYVDLSYTRSHPPPGVDVQPGDYVGAALTVRAEGRNLYGSVRARGGIDLSANSPDWGEVSGLGGGQILLSPALSLGLASSGFLLGYTGPSEFRAWAAMAQPSIQFGKGPVGAMAQGRVWIGETYVRTSSAGGPIFGTPGELVASGLDLDELSLDGWVAIGPATTGLGGDLSWAETARYATGRAWLSTRPTDRAELVAIFFLRDRVNSAGDIPVETGFLASALYEIDRNVGVEATVTRTLTDLLLGSPQTLAVGLTLRFRLGRSSTAPTEGSLPSVRRFAEVLPGQKGASTRTIRFSLEVSARSVTILGDFTRWEPRPMQKASEGRWRWETELPPGVYRFAFRVDGTWYVPENAESTAEDGFGQKNLVLVVPGP